MRLSEFYDDPLRGMSVEVGFGATWQLGGYGPWKVMWLEDTGELVAFNETHAPGTVVAGGVSSAGGNLLADLALDLVFEAAIQGVVHLFVHHEKRAPVPEDLNQFREEVAFLLVERDLARVRLELAGWEQHARDADGLAWLFAQCQLAAGS